MAFRTISVCAGVGGLDLGVRIARPDARCVAFVEREASAAASLVASMEAGRLHPAAVWSDLRTFDAGAWRGAVDCVLSGDPCQGNSVAGKRLGAADARWLLDRAIEVFDESGAAVFFRENVVGNLAGQIAAAVPALERMGCRVACGIFSAAEAGASHRRERFFLLAHRCGDDTGDTTDLTRIEARRSEQKARGINGNGFGQSLGEAARTWRTPNAAMADHGPMSPTYRKEKGQMVTLDDQVSEWRTPQAGDATRGSKSERGSSNPYKDKAGRHSLVTEAANWATPTARMHKGGGEAVTRADGKSRLDMLDWQAEDWAKGVRAFAMTDLSLPDRPTPSGLKSSETRRRLNPLFVEWLMGWPEGLSGFDTAAMGSCHSPQPLHGCGCMDCWLTQQRAMLSELLTIDPPAQGLLL